MPGAVKSAAQSVFAFLRQRNFELAALIVATGMGFLGPQAVRFSTHASRAEAAQLGLGLALSFLALHLTLRVLCPYADRLIAPSAAALAAIGLTMIYRLSPDKAAAQLGWIVLGAVLCVLTVVVARNYRGLAQFKYLTAVTAIALMVSPALIGREVNGAKLWLKFGGLSFQPAEVAKILMVVFLAAYLSEKRELLTELPRRFLGISWPRLKYLGPLLTMWAISLVLLVFEKDLGSSLLFFGIFLTMVFIATDRWIYVIAGSALFLAGAAAAYRLFSHVRVRVDIWLDPWADFAGRGYQIVQSLFAVAGGGLIGTGLGAGYGYKIPAVSTDFVFSVVAEELGLTGAIGIILLYFIIVYRGLRIALESEDPFGKLLAAGLAATFGLQSLVIMGGVTKLIPLTGVTLPFLSYGGSSILANFILLGLLLVVSEESEATAAARQAESQGPALGGRRRHG